MTTNHKPATALPYVTEGFSSLGDDGKIYRSNGSKIVETKFEDRKDRSFEVRCAATIAETLPVGSDRIEFSITQYGEKRSKHASFCLRDFEQIRRLRNICNLALGETVQQDAYPRLVEALRGVCEAYGCECIEEPPHCPMCTARALLSELGEL